MILLADQLESRVAELAQHSKGVDTGHILVWGYIANALHFSRDEGGQRIRSQISKTEVVGTLNVYLQIDWHAELRHEFTEAQGLDSTA